MGDIVNGFLFRDGDGQVTVLDMGLKRSGKKIVAALGAIGSGPGDVTRLLLTHAHADHAGGTGYVARATGRGVGGARRRRGVRAGREGGAGGLRRSAG